MRAHLPPPHTAMPALLPATCRIPISPWINPRAARSARGYAPRVDSTGSRPPRRTPPSRITTASPSPHPYFLIFCILGGALAPQPGAVKSRYVAHEYGRVSPEEGMREVMWLLACYRG